MKIAYLQAHNASLFSQYLSVKLNVMPAISSACPSSNVIISGGHSLKRLGTMDLDTEKELNELNTHTKTLKLEVAIFILH